MAEIVPVTTSYEVTQHAPGQYEVKQVVEDQQVDLNSGNRVEFSFDIKIVSVVGYYDPDSQSIGVYPKILGQQIGDGYAASLKHGLTIQLVLALYNGSLRFNKEGNSIKAYLHLKPLLPWGDEINEQVTVLNI
ncbi:hypothetical protein QBC42DRAFT_210150 [Cladorrhinum samala]|uniref:Uncharacterized protein n=1 Tax=Cladorrhinum samala TaxID=585594 RepID=A0AAV9HDK3_9PEZI|nr:hypothetical protein QBC42DRAFT_210150 [Cladorrhinum samala]